MSTHRPRRLRPLALAVVATTLAAGLAACGASSSSSSSSTAAATSGGATAVKIAVGAGEAYPETTISVPTVAEIRAELPEAARTKGTLTIGVGALPGGFPPLAYVGDDDKTLTGSEPDLGRLVAAVLGLKPVVANSTWENLFVGFDSGRTDVGFTNVTVTEERKLKYDFASYRQDNLGFEVTKSSTWEFAGDYENLAGQTVAVGSGTNQEKILLEWRDTLKKEGKTLTVKYFADQAATYLALNSGRINAYFGPNPGIAYHVSQVATSAQPTRTAGTFSGAGATLQGLIAATTKKDSGWAKPVADAIDYLIENGQYATWLKTYNLANEAVTTSEVNPAGLPLTNS